MDDEQRSDGTDPVRQGHYGPGALDEVTVPATDPVREAKRRDVHDPADVPVDPDDLRNGGPTRTPGMRTTTGSSAGPGGPGRAGPAPLGEPAEDDAAEDETARTVAPTTTGDATSGGMGTPVGGATSDATTGATSGGDFTNR